MEEQNKRQSDGLNITGGFDDEVSQSEKEGDGELASSDEKARKDADKKSEKRKKLSNYEKHLRPCPHCGKEILDHFTECPHCGKAVEPRGYHADEQKLARVKRITQIIGLVLTIGLVAAILVFMFKKTDGKDCVELPERVGVYTSVGEAADFSQDFENANLTL